MRAKDPRSKCSWMYQANLHSFYCSGCPATFPVQIHGCPFFFPWHRAYVYYYERILGALVGDMDHFRLPSWDWETLRSLPDAYRVGNNALCDQNRNSQLKAGGVLFQYDASIGQIQSLFMWPNYNLFRIACEENPHERVHFDVGSEDSPHQDMGDFTFAALDPLFFAHHCKIDKLWSQWNMRADSSGSFQKPGDSAFLDKSWTFYDEKEQAVSISSRDVLNHVENLRYSYPEPPSYVWSAPVLSEEFDCRLVYSNLDSQHRPFVHVTSQVLQTILARSHSGSPIMLIVPDVQIPTGLSGAFNVNGVRGAKRTQIGTLTILGSAMQHTSSRTLILTITEAVEDLLASQGDAQAVIEVVTRSSGDAFTPVFVLPERGAKIRTAPPSGRNLK